uniref:Uncharacterized protein n=2 Tax=unclassified Mycobacterium TaxID=2642494 RepID=A0A5Q5BRW1_MYCSS
MNPGGSHTVGAMTTVSLRRSIGDLTFDHVLVPPDGPSDGTVSAPTILVFLGMEGRSDAQIAIAVHHGWDDPPAPPEDVVAERAWRALGVFLSETFRTRTRSPRRPGRGASTARWATAPGTRAPSAR